MKLVASPHTHPESPISGSTVEGMIDRAEKLGRKYFSYTDFSYMTSIYRGYLYIEKKKKNLKYIPGLEIFFKDASCPIIKGSKAEKAKYFKLTLYATNQESFQKMGELSSRDTGSLISYYGSEFPCWDWKMLQEAADAGLVACSSDIHDIVGKHIVTGTPQLATPILLKLKEMFKDRYYVSIVGNQVSHSWVNLVHFELEDGTEEVIVANSRISTNAAKFAYAKEMVENPNKHHHLKSYQKNFVTIPLKDPGLRIVKASIKSGFFPFPEGDVQLTANKLMSALAERHGIAVLYSDYAFYAEPEDKQVQDVRLSQDEIKEHSKRHMQTSEEAEAYLSQKMGMTPEKIDQIMENNSRWASLFDDFKLKYSYSLPTSGDGKPALERCLEIIKQKGRLPKDNPVYVERLRHEISVLAHNGKMDLTPYFLPIVDVLDYYEKNGSIVGPGRGSAGGSLFAYLMGITQIDPIKYDLSFERFQSLDRILNGDYPDIDQDLPSRNLLVGEDGNSGYLYGRWGNKAAQISTRIQLRLKSAIRDVNKYVNNGTIEPEIERLSKALPVAPQGISDKDFIFGYEDTDGNHFDGLIEVSKELQEYASSRPREWDIVQRSLGISRQFSAHASAFVISDNSIKDTVPTFLGNITQYEAKGVEACGLIKFDFLVVKQLEDIEKCVKLINKKNKEKEEASYFAQNGERRYIWDLPQDLEVYKSVWEGDTQTIFQINTQSMIPYVMRIKPRSIEDLATILALVRPGPLDFIDPVTGLNAAEEYIERREGRGTIDIPELVDLLPKTYGSQVYQEDTSKVAREIGKMKPADAENLRRVFSKKDKAKALAMKPLFIEGATKTVGLEKAEKIWAQMETSSRYSFNCISKDELVKTSKGLVSMEEICKDVKKYEVAYWDFKEEMIKYETPTVGIAMGTKEVWKVELEDGTMLECTPDHKFLSEGNWIPLSEIVEKGLSFEVK
mgnify:CR=1 FL=1